MQSIPPPLFRGSLFLSNFSTTTQIEKYKPATIFPNFFEPRFLSPKPQISLSLSLVELLKIPSTTTEKGKEEEEKKIKQSQLKTFSNLKIPPSLKPHFQQEIHLNKNPKKKKKKNKSINHCSFQRIPYFQTIQSS